MNTKFQVLSEFGQVEKVICIDDRRDPRLTLHKVYDGIVFSKPKTVMIIANDGLEKTYSNKALIPLSEYRQMKLGEIGL